MQLGKVGSTGHKQSSLLILKLLSKLGVKQYPLLPAKRFINRMANIILIFIKLILNYHIKKITIRTFISPPTDSRRQYTNAFMLGLWLINLKGLKILSILTIFKNPRL
jgi:hypothetical protein